MNKPKKIDVVIPTKGEPSLIYCVKLTRKYVPVNNLILVASRRTRNLVENLGDIIIYDDRKNVGIARSLGLKEVKTEFYASIDSDVLLNPSWYKWCIKTIEDETVAACQGYAKPIGKIRGHLQERFIRDGGMYGKGLAGLGNTLLKTKLVRKVGMPKIPVGEDWALRNRLEAIGYKWISNVNLQSKHLQTDIDTWKHAIWWGKISGLKNVKPRLLYLLTLAYVGWTRYSVSEVLFQIVERLCILYGACIHARMNQKTSDLVRAIRQK